MERRAGAGGPSPADENVMALGPAGRQHPGELVGNLLRCGVRRAQVGLEQVEHVEILAAHRILPRGARRPQVALGELRADAVVQRAVVVVHGR
jgi:hypothetical protein